MEARRTILHVMLAAALAGCSGARERSTPGPVVGRGADAAAVEVAAVAWLEIIDSGAYRRSWEEAAPEAQRVFPVDQWVEAIRGLRRRVGALQSRALQEITIPEAIPGAPEGEYVLLEFRTRFAHDFDTIERVVMAADGVRWRGFSYSVRSVPR